MWPRAAEGDRKVLGALADRISANAGGQAGEELGGADSGKGCPFLVYPHAPEWEAKGQISRRQSVSERPCFKNH